MSPASQVTLTFVVMYFYTLKPKSCAGHNSHTVKDNLIIFGRDIWSVPCKKDNSSCGHFLVTSVV